MLVQDYLITAAEQFPTRKPLFTQGEKLPMGKFSMVQKPSLTGSLMKKSIMVIE